MINQYKPFWIMNKNKHSGHNLPWLSIHKHYHCSINHPCVAASLGAREREQTQDGMHSLWTHCSVRKIHQVLALGQSLWPGWRNRGPLCCRKGCWSPHQLGEGLTLPHRMHTIDRFASPLRTLGRSYFIWDSLTRTLPFVGSVGRDFGEQQRRSMNLQECNTMQWNAELIQ